MTKEELNAMYLHGSDAPPQWEVNSIGLPRTRAYPIRGHRETVESRAGMSADQLQPPEVAHSEFVANTTY